jgi:acetyl-CoA carboxylase carboxyltransferase component
MLYLVDAAGGRSPSRSRSSPAAFHAGRIFYNEVQLSGVVPQICILFGPSPAGSAYLPALTDLVIMVEGKASLYVGSPRMVEMAIGEKTTLEELGGARMHCEVSGCGDVLAASDEEAIELASATCLHAGLVPRDAGRGDGGRAQPGPVHRRDRALRPAQVVRHVRGDRPVVDAGSWFEIKKLFAAEIIVGLRRIGGRASASSPTSPRSRAAC